MKPTTNIFAKWLFNVNEAFDIIEITIYLELLYNMCTRIEIIIIIRTTRQNTRVSNYPTFGPDADAMVVER
jgi:hypothetical protein